MVEKAVGKKKDFEPASGLKNEWCVKEASTKLFGKASYDPIRSYVNGMPITSMNETFSGCENLEAPPTIPETVTDITLAFNQCMGLRSLPKIPASVKKMSRAFDGVTDVVDGATIVIDANPSEYTDWFKPNYNECSITITGASSVVSNISPVRLL